MKTYLAPLEGITTYIYRNALEHHYGGVDKYFTPFITSATMSHREQMDVLPEHNQGIELVPQILTNRVDEFLEISHRLYTDFGYETVNLNLGCPSGTVVSKKRGAGFLSVPDKLDAFLYEIFEKSEPRISIKTRIGIEDVGEWEALLKIYAKYPMEELIIHPRLQKEFYQGTPHVEAYLQAAAQIPKEIPLCYNGDIVQIDSLLRLFEGQQTPENIMVGRGVIARPWLMKELHAGEEYEFDAEVFSAFHDEIYHEYQDYMSGGTNVLFKMKELWSYWIVNFSDDSRLLKKIYKSKKLSEYEKIVGTVLLS